MSITDELRCYINEQQWCAKGVLTAIANRIDMAHEHGMEERADRYSELRAKMNNCYVELPKDADGEPIHIGDVMEWVRYKDDDLTIVRTVSGIGNGVFFAWSDEQGRYAQYEAHAYRHHHAPTVEDVLREFAQKMNENMGMYTGEAIDADEWQQADSKTIAEYAAKLQLRGDAE